MVTTTFPLASFLPCYAGPVVLGEGFGQEGRRLCFLFTYPTLIHLVWTLESEQLLFWSWGMRLLSPPSSLSPRLTQLEQTKWPRLPYSAVLLLDSSMPHHNPKNEWVGKWHHVWKTVCSVVKSVSKHTITSSLPLVLTSVNSSFMMPAH